ncbi:MAG: TetR/AcrR family transcriptional regulator [Clostridium sp.]|nr:TetR/AcrR family transcriptional regulator [Clostridium sp.]MDU7084633.1 TetR/AcrR family transcriptional regulator [Clostridium sp.]
MDRDVDRKILNAALEVVSKEKISGTRMHIIAKEANMSQANLHYHFSTKNDIMVALLESIQEEFSRGRGNYIDSKSKSLDENIKGFFEQKKDDILINKKMEYAQIDYWVQSTVNEEMRDIFKKTFNIWRENIKEVLPENSDENLPYIMVSLMLGASLQYLIDEGKFSLDDYFKVAEEMMLNQCEKKEALKKVQPSVK